MMRSSTHDQPQLIAHSHHSAPAIASTYQAKQRKVKSVHAGQDYKSPRCGCSKKRYMTIMMNDQRGNIETLERQLSDVSQERF